jgi:beta-glucanase (GH16 family)
MTPWTAIHASAAPLPGVDDFEAGLPTGTDTNGISIGFVTFNDPNSTVAISTTDAPPAPVPGAAGGNHVLKMDVNVVSYAGFVHNFENAALDTWVSQDWSAYEGISFMLYGNNSGTTMFVDVLDNRNPGSTKDDAERWSIDVQDNFSGWQEVKIPFASMHRKEIGNGAPNDGFGLTEVFGWALGTITTPAPQTYYVDDVKLYGTAPIKPLTVSFTAIDYKVTEGGTATVSVKLSKASPDPVTVDYATSFGSAIADRDYTPVSGTLTFQANSTSQSFTVQTFDDQKYQGERGVLAALSNPTGGAGLGQPAIARVDVVDNESYDPTLLEDFETYPYLWSASGKTALSNLEIPAGDSLALPGQGAFEHVLQMDNQKSKSASVIFRNYPIGQDWGDSGGLNFWYFGQNSKKSITVNLANNPVTQTDPAAWNLVWSDEFNGKAGTAANPNVWGQEVGDGTVNGIPGWGNSELEYYTDGTANAAADGKGNLQITTKKADGSLMCYYGPCQYTSARLLTNKRFEVAYGRVEARMKIAKGTGLWPAFWMLGTNIDQVGWPQSGEIDIMENVGREPNLVFGTLHGPGYSGGQSYGKTLDLGTPVGDDFHTFAVEWQPDQINWFVDGNQFFTATPQDAFLQGKQWVFNHPFYVLMNVAVGGNFGGQVGPDAVFPQKTLVDYVRLYQAAPQPVTFSTTFVDDFGGWKKISLPFSAFTNPDGGTLDPTSVSSLQVVIPGNITRPVLIDQIRLSCPSEMTVTSAEDSGVGSLRKAIGSVCAGGTVHFAPELAGQTITLTSGPLTLGKNVTIDGSAAPGVILSGNNADRVFIINAGTTAAVSYLTVRDGKATDLAGAILDNGTLTLDHCIVTNNSVVGSNDWWKGGGAIYVGGGGTLNLTNSTVNNNSTQNLDGGGLYGFQNSVVNITNSTLSDNTAGNVGGGFRSLGNAVIDNSTFSGNKSLAWHGGAIFHTDGTLKILNSTIANNIGPDWAPSAIFLGNFGGPTPTLELTNTLITGNHWYACDHWTGTVNIVSGGHNLVQDATCNAGSPDPTDIITGTALVGPLADNGGPTQTHALLAGSPAIDAADDALCPATDQRGVARPQGAHCDIGSYEYP